MSLTGPIYVIISSDSYPEIYRRLRALGFNSGIDGAAGTRDRKLIAESGCDWRTITDNEAYARITA